MKTLFPLILIAALALAACAPKADKPRFNAASAVDAIRNGEVNWNADWKSGDAGKIAAHFAPEAVVMLPHLAPVTGLEAIRALAQRSMDDPAFTFSFSSDKVDVAASGDLAVSRGSFTENATDPDTKKPVAIAGSFVTVYKPRADGNWKAVWDIVTPGPPPVLVK